MTDSKHQRALEIQGQVRQALMSHWDPIGVKGHAGAEDEYDAYVGPVYRLLSSGATDGEIIDYLYDTETQTMGLIRLKTRGHLKKTVARLREIDVKL